MMLLFSSHIPNTFHHTLNVLSTFFIKVTTLLPITKQPFVVLRDTNQEVAWFTIKLRIINFSNSIYKLFSESFRISFKNL